MTCWSFLSQDDANLVPVVSIDGMGSILSDCDIILYILERSLFVEWMLINSELEGRL